MARSIRELLSIGESRGKSLRSGGSFFLFMGTIGVSIGQRTKFSLIFSLYQSLSRDFYLHQIILIFLTTKLSFFVKPLK